MNCPACGVRNAPDAQFCTSCMEYLGDTSGATSGDKSGQSASAADQAPKTTAPPLPPTQPAGTGRPNGQGSAETTEPLPAVTGQEPGTAPQPKAAGQVRTPAASLDDDLGPGLGEGDADSTAALLWRCFRCSTTNPASLTFCQRCGATSEAAAQAQSEPATRSEPLRPEAKVAAAPIPEIFEAPAEPSPAVSAHLQAVQPSRGVHDTAPLDTSRSATTAPERPAPAAVPPGQIGCPRCGTASPAELHFCRKCGAELHDRVAQTSPGPAAPPPQRKGGWWSQPAFPRGDAESAARRQYSRALSVRHRVLRGAAILAAVGIPVALVTTHMSPVRYLQRQYAIRMNPGSLSVIPGVTATAAPVPTDPKYSAHPPNLAIDRLDNSFWATSPTAPGVLTLRLSHPSRLTGITVLTGIKDPQSRPGQPIPAELQLIAGKKVKNIVLKDDAKPHRYIFVSDLPRSSLVQIRILKQFPPGNGRHDDLLAISTLQLLHY